MKNIQETLPLETLPLKLRFFERTGQLETCVPYSHWHSQAELVYNRKGYGMQQINEIFFVVPPGSFTLVGPNQLHSYTACSQEEEMELWVIQFEPDSFLQNFREDSRFSQEWISGRLLFSEAIPGEPEFFPLLQGIRRELEEKREGYMQAVTAYMLQLLVGLYRRNPERLSARECESYSSQNRTLLSQTFRFISDHYREDSLSLEQAAEAANLSVTHFCRLFRTATGTSFHDYLSQYRISRAEQLLTTGKSLTEIALSCGFGSISAFTRNYKKYKGMPPRQAKKIRGQDPSRKD